MSIANERSAMQRYPLDAYSHPDAMKFPVG
jgi:hypothetical protein